jgi:hypothetical protein
VTPGALLAAGLLAGPAGAEEGYARAGCAWWLGGAPEGIAAIEGCSEDAAPSAAQRQALAQVLEAYTQRFGPPEAGMLLGVSDWGRVTPPLRPFSKAEVAAQLAGEGLTSEEQREKAVIATGPTRDGVPVYLHFLGSDPPWSDLWGTPETVAGLLALADEWQRHCTERVAPAKPEVCALQFGDLSWYRKETPDPLGHSGGHKGRCVDIRLFRDDGSRYEAWWNQPDDRQGVTGGYSRPLNHEFLRLALESQELIEAHFNDPAIHEVLDDLEPYPGHDDHIHLCW